jgi:uroporphyrinogen decarboxylase
VINAKGKDEMTKRERVIAAIRHEKLDYTPFNSTFTGAMYNKMVAYTGNHEYERAIGNHIAQVTLLQPQTPVSGRRSCYADEFGVVWNKSGEGDSEDIGVISGLVIEDADALAAYNPPPIDEPYIRAQCEELMRTKGDCFAIVNLGFSLFERAWTLCGMENLMCYMLTDAEALESLMAKLSRRTVEIVKIALAYEIDGVIFGDDWGQQKGLLMGAPHWRRFIKPYLTEMYAAVRETGRFVAQHSCGDISEIFDDLIAIGLNIYQTFQPEIYDLRTYKQRLYGRLTIWGGISTQAHLPFATPEEVYRRTKETLSIMGAGGGLIASPTHDVPGDVPPENIEAMIRAFKDQPRRAL